MKSVVRLVAALAVATSLAAASRAPQQKTHFLHAGVLEQPAAILAQESGSSWALKAEAILDDLTWQKVAIAAGVAFLLGSVAAGVGVKMALQKKQDMDKLDDAVADFGESATASAAPAEEAAAASATTSTDVATKESGVDYEEMLKLLAARVTQMYGPKLAKASALRSICESRARGFIGKTKELLLAEIGGTAGSLLKECGSEEAMLLVDFDNAVGSYFPPLAVLMAGLMSPTVLVLSFWNHVIQVVIVHVPVMILCVWAIWQDYGAACGGVPTLFSWTYVQAAVALLLSVGHLAVALEIKQGQATIKEKTDEMQAKLTAKAGGAPDDMALVDVRELFISTSVLLQQALLAEERVRRSVFNWTNGALTIGSLVMTVWTFVINLKWLTIPGQVAMHVKAQDVVAASEFCGAWASIIAIRTVMLLSVIFLVMNLVSVWLWLGENLLHSPAATQDMVKKAKDFDNSTLGLPVAQTFVKAFVLRGSSDMLSSQLSMAGSMKGRLELERAEIQSQMEAVQAKLTVTKGEVASYQEACMQAGADDKLAQKRAEIEATLALIQEKQAAGLAGVEGASTQAAADIESAKAQAEAMKKQLEKQGTEALKAAQDMAPTPEEMRARAQAIEEYTKAELNKMWEKMTDLMQQIQESEVVQKALEESQKKAAEALEAAKNVDVDAAMEQAKKMGEDAVEAAKSMDVEKAKKMAEDAVEAAKNVDMDALAEQAKQGVEQAKKVASEAAEKVDVEAIKASAAAAAEQAKETASAAGAAASEAATEAASSAAAAAKPKDDSSKKGRKKR